MKEFFKDCLQDLESLTGIRQLYFLESDHDKGAEKIKVCIDGMMYASQDYPYIPEEKQKQIIREQMVKDQNYDALNSRVIHRWLSMFKDKYWTLETGGPGEQIHTPAPPEVADKYIAQIQENLSKIGKPEFKNGFAELRKKAGHEASISASQPRPEFVVGETCPECKGGGEVCPNGEANQYPVLCEICEGTGKIDRFLVHADNQAEADRAYEAFVQSSQPKKRKA